MALRGKNCYVVQKILLSGTDSLAPEIENGEAHNYKADIWALGQLAYQIMSVQSEASKPVRDVLAQDALWLDGVPEDFKVLVAVMVGEKPSARPSAAQLLDHHLLAKFRKANIGCQQ